MGHRGSFVVVRDGVAVASNDQWGGMVLAELIESGRVKCVEYACSLDPSDEVLAEPWAEAGFMVDFDRHEALVFCSPSSDFVGWDDGLTDEQRAEREFLDSLLSDSPGRWVEQVQSHWEGFALRYVDSASEFVEHLEAFNIVLVAPFRRYHLRAAVTATVPNLVTDEVRREQLGGQAAGAKVGEADGRSAGLLSAGILAAMLIVLPLALFVRLVTFPLRRVIKPQQRLDEKEQRGREQFVMRLRELAKTLREDPHDTEALDERGNYLVRLKHYGQAELDFDHCMRELNEDTPAFGKALYNRGVARGLLGLESLSTVDIEDVPRVEASSHPACLPGLAFSFVESSLCSCSPRVGRTDKGPPRWRAVGRSMTFLRRTQRIIAARSMLLHPIATV